MAANDTIPLPNPYTPMAFVPPEIARNMQHETYAFIGSLAVLLWDIFLHIAQDYRVAKFGINFSFIIYCIARVTLLAHILGVVVISTAPVGDCDLAQRMSILAISIPLSILPFLMRVSAFYNNNRYVIAFFTTLWLVVLGCYAASPTYTSGMPKGSSRHCSIARNRVADVITSSSILVYDSLIFIATSWAFMRLSYSNVTVKNGVRVMVFGRFLPAFSKSVLQDGQIYYLVTLLLNILFCALVYVPNSPISACAVAFPFYVLLNNMASHVYRNVRLGFYQDRTIGSSVANRGFQESRRSSHHHPKFINPTSIKLEDREAPEGGDITKSRTSQETQRDIKQRVGV